MIRSDVLAYAKRVNFKEINPITTYNNRLILRVDIEVDANSAYDYMILYEGKYHFHEGVLEIIKKRRPDTEELCNKCKGKIIEAANKWCKDLGLPELTE